MQQISAPLTIFLIGATGDLARKKIWAALYNLHCRGLLPDVCHIVGVARSQYSIEDFQQFVKDVVQPPENAANWQAFTDKIFYVSGDVSQLSTFEELRRQHIEFQHCGNHLWYVATLPSLYLPIIRNIKAVGMQNSDCGWTKLLLEKPFGTDVSTSQKLNQELLQVFEEDQLYRIDHFLAKETVQNLLVFRFGNGLFEHLWNYRYVDHIQITASEQIGIGSRGQFFESTGTVRDVVQNHILQMLAMTLMEEPVSLEPQAIRKQRMEFLSQLEVLDSRDLPGRVKFGQYDTGEVAGKKVPSYLNEDGVGQNSRTETAVALKLFVNSERWHGVPVYIRAGKRLKESVTEISLKFKEPLNKMFSGKDKLQTGNVLTLRIQPNEGVIVRLNVKKPGLSLDTEEVSMQFCYKTEFQMGLVEAYEKLLYDAVQGDTTLFPQAADIEASWRFVQPVLDYLAEPETQPEKYQAGSWGPESFQQLIGSDKRQWLEPRPDVCVIK